jgi:hypothetical protein
MADGNDRSLDAMLTEIEDGWEDTAPCSGTFEISFAILQPSRDAATAPLCHRERFVLMHVDGASTYAELLATLEAVGSPREQTAPILQRLMARKLLVIKKRRMGKRRTA